MTWVSLFLTIGTLGYFVLINEQLAAMTVSRSRREVAAIASHGTGTYPAQPKIQDTFEDKETFSSCLLIMDDNHRLPEWIAYHYFALPLRHLIVAVDPNSKTSPNSILDQWKDLINIEVWSDADFTSEDLKILPGDSAEEKTTKHRHRQVYFYQACAEYLQEEKGRTWTTFHDIDEYIALNHDVIQDTNAKMLASQPGHVIQMVKKYSETEYRNTAQVEPALWYTHFQRSSCVTIARAMYSAVESKPEETAKDVPDFIDPVKFDTLRFRHRESPRTKLTADGKAKSIIDVSKLTEKDYATAGHNMHRPIQSVCPSDRKIKYNDLPLGIHHYLGSWEAYSFRDDARDGQRQHNFEAWNKKAFKHEGGPDDQIRPWISGFANQVGAETARRLLQDAGLPKPPLTKNLRG